MAKRSKNQQIPTLFNPKAAGRPRLKEAKLKWIRRNGRTKIPAQTPVHVTVKLKQNIIASLRTKQIFKHIKLALGRARAKGLKILHFSIQKDHIHFLIEAKHKQQLAQGMQSFGVSLALSLKKLVKLGQSSYPPGIFKDRYHVNILNSPTEVKRVAHYIARNGPKHRVVATMADPYSSSILMKHLQQVYKDFFKHAQGFKRFREQMRAQVDPPSFWLSQQILLVA